MKRVYLFCDNGMSTSMMAQRMQDVATVTTCQLNVRHFHIKSFKTSLKKIL